MTLALLHGEILVGWFFTGAVAIFAAVGIGLWFWRYPPRAPILPTAIYLLAAIVGSLLWMSHTSDLLLSSIGFALTLPWSALFLFAVMSFDVQIPAWIILPGMALNAGLVYLAMRRLATRRSAHGAG